MVCMCFCLFCSHSDLDLRQCDILVAKKIGLAYNYLIKHYFLTLVCSRKFGMSDVVLFVKIKDNDNPRYIIQNWMRNRNTVEFLGVWETLCNPDFNRVEFDAVRTQVGLNSFVMTPQK